MGSRTQLVLEVAVLCRLEDAVCLAVCAGDADAREATRPLRGEN